MSALNEVMYGKIARLSHTWRYSAQPVIIRENVAEHSFWTAVIGVTIAEEIGEERVAGDVAINALFHDIEECMTGDVIRDMKYATDEFRQHFAVIERAFVEQLTEDMGETGNKMLNTWADAKIDTKAGKIVALADFLSVLAYCTREYTLGNASLQPIRQAMVDSIIKKFTGTNLEKIGLNAINGSYERWPSA